MKCIYCGFDETKVVDKRNSDAGDFVRRRRECVKCEKRFTTFEKPGKAELLVIKKEENKEEFQRDKLEKSIQKACAKGDVKPDEIIDIVEDIEMRLLNRRSKEVSSGDIGRMVLTRLKKLDKISYMRFASVFLDFEDLEDFKSEIQKLSTK